MEIKQAVIKVWDLGTYKASVQIAGSLSVWLENISVNRALADGDMVVGRKCTVIFFGDSTSPTDAVLVAVWV